MRVRNGWLVLLGAWSGAAGNGCSNGDADGSTDTDTGCDFVIVSQYPAEGATGVFERAVVDVVLGQEQAGSTITVTDAAGVEVAGASASDRGRTSFQAAVPYTAGETYTARFDWSCPSVSWTFTVTDTPLPPLADPESLVGRSFQLDLRAGRAAFPIFIDDVLDGQMEVDLLLGVLGVTGSDLDLRASSTDDTRAAQDLTSETTDFSAPFADNPYLVVVRDSLRLVIFNDTITASELTLSAAWDAAADTFVEVSLDTIIDTRELVDIVVGEDAGDDAVCELFSSTYGVRCHDCPVPGLYAEPGDFCITMVLDGMTLTDFPDPIVEVAGTP